MFYRETQFQDSPIGKLPKDWETSSLGDYCEKAKAGGTPLTTNRDYWNGDVPFVKIEDMTTSGKYLTKTKTCISNEGLANSSAWIVPENSLLLAVYGSMGDISINKIPVSTNQAVLGIMPKNRKDVDFLYYWYMFFKPRWKKYSKATTQANLTAEIVKDSYVPVPSQQEREGIVEVLGVVDSAIELADKVIAKTERVKKGLMQKLLREGIGHKEFKETKVAKIPKEWQVLSCPTLCNEITVGIVVTPAKYYESSGVPCFRSFNILDDEIDPRDLAYISPASNELHKKSILHIGDVVVVRSGKPGIAAVVPREFDGANCVDLIILRPNQTIDPHFLSIFLNSPLAKKQILAGQGGTAQQHFNIGMVKKLSIVVPPIGEQKKISEIFSVVAKKIKLEETQREELARIKQGLMDLFFTGKIRVKVD